MTMFNTRRFNYDRRTGVLSAEMSELNEGGKEEVFTQIFNDSCDLGFTLVSHKSGRAVRMYVYHTQKDNDGDVQFWKLKPYAPDLRLDILTFDMIIYND